MTYEEAVRVCVCGHPRWQHQVDPEIRIAMIAFLQVYPCNVKLVSGDRCLCQDFVARLEET